MGKRKLDLKSYTQKQKEEALGAVNRYFFWQKYNRDGSDHELMMYYCEAGGAQAFAKRRSEFEKEEQ
jgi:hypothetical protein